MVDLSFFKFNIPLSNLEVDKAIFSIDTALEKLRNEGKTETDQYKLYLNIQKALLGWDYQKTAIARLSEQNTGLKLENDYLKQQNAKLAEELNNYTTLEKLDMNGTLDWYLEQLREIRKTIKK